MADENTQLQFLDAASVINDSDLMHIKQGAADKKIDFSIIKDNILDNLPAGSETTVGGLELATSAETVAALSTTLATHPLGVKALIDSLLASFKDEMYPVGSIYENSAVSTNPATLLGFGTWVLHGVGRATVCIDTGDSNFDTLGKLTGSKNAVVVTHTHTGDTLSSGSHVHDVLMYRLSGGSVSAATAILEQSNAINNDQLGYTLPSRALSAGTHAHPFTTDSSGENGTNKNIQPSIVTYRWTRTA